MNELQMQKFIVDAVNADGGFAHKLSNRFLVGVVDLLVKMIDWPAGVLEAKQRVAPKRELEFELDVTVPQKQFLRKAHKAGVPSGVVSFMKDKPGVRGLSVCIRSYEWMVNSNWVLSSKDHHPLWAKGQDFSPEVVMTTLLNEWFRGLQPKSINKL